MNQAEYSERLQELQTLQQQRETLKAEAEQLYAEFEQTASAEVRVKLLELLKQEEEKRAEYKQLSQAEYQGQQVQLYELVALEKIKKQFGKTPPFQTLNGRVTQLSLQSSNSNGILNLKLLPNLESLNVWDCKNLTGIINPPASLRELYAGGTGLREDLDLTPCQNLEKLDVRYCHNITGISNPPASLKELYAGGTGLSGDLDLTPYPNLESLDVTICKNLTGISNPPASLKELYAQGSGLNKQQIESLCQQNSNLTITT
jgi:hypothetical protein